ncbi:MAG: hypothetical protein ACKVOP_11980 [Sphingomonadaceae bacterium]
MSIFGDAMAAIRNVILMQANLERMDRQLETLDKTQDGFREALFRLSERLTRVESVLFDQRPATRKVGKLPKESS